ncbi:glycoside hydrolase family 13 protein [Pseudocercospora fijiensis CIRAD86]|uniref:Glycoside hydrolase family 13 protein n=1 Tax=Pseudocercospora fijiensis (strain CIRAD86) TaxID=383855 RepID=M3B7C1_PSEFD|nr:glycoside hydrolase family 13 protein [Pseudocercospora fijiensis CIRAD86]EME85212.1 glycoside hydrolase family 13 protein [Pseudocercospora fijiensis CIRAD86]
MPPLPPNREWFHTATIYELYPSSFADSNSDGIGDIPGILRKIPYLEKLGVDAVWVAACYKSGGIDMGYDVENYREIDPQYGRVGDVETLVRELGRVGVRVIMDLVVNHTSSEHAWFKESRSGLTNSKRDWYIWRRGRTIDGIRHPPNNWASIFQGSAWEYDATTDEYYLRTFAKQQPDLNWENAEMRKAVYEDMKFWLEKGVAGFRMDVINLISKAEGFPDAPIVDEDRDEQFGGGLYCNGARVHAYLREMRREVLDRYAGSVAVGEVIITSSTDMVREFVCPERRELSMVYQYDLFDIDCGKTGKFSAREWKLGEFKGLIAKWQNALSYSNGGWATVWLESHDTGRSVTRFGDGTEANRFKVAKLLALLESTLGGTLFVYQGQELGLKALTTDVPIKDYPDVETQRTWDAIFRQRKTALPCNVEPDMTDVAEQVRIKARDHARTPLPWTSVSEAPHAGFSDTKGKTWSPMNTDSDVCNIAQQDSDPQSVLNFWRERIRIRKQCAETLVFGDFEAVPDTMNDGPVFAYWRKPLIDWTRKARGVHQKGDRDVLVVLNLTPSDDVTFEMPPIPDLAKHDGILPEYFALQALPLPNTLIRLAKYSYFFAYLRYITANIILSTLDAFYINKNKYVGAKAVATIDTTIGIEEEDEEEESKDK